MMVWSGYDTSASALNDFITNNPESLVLYFSEPNPNFLRISQYFTETGFPIKLMSVGSAQYKSMYENFYVESYPLLRYYYGDTGLFVDYSGDLNDSEEDIEEQDEETTSYVIDHVSDFLRGRTVYNIKNLQESGVDKLKEIWNLDDFLVVWLGDFKDLGAYRNFEGLSKTNERVHFFEFDNLSDLKHLSNEVYEAMEKGDYECLRDSKKGSSKGLYILTNFNGELKIMKLLDEEEKIDTDKSTLIKLGNMVLKYQYPPLPLWELSSDEQLLATKDVFILVFNEPYFEHALVSKTNKRNILAYYDEVNTNLKEFGFFDKRVPILKLTHNCEACTDYLKSIIGEKHFDSFLYFFEVRSKKGKVTEILKYRFIAEDVYSIKFDVRLFLSAIRDEKIQDFFRTELITDKSTRYGKIKRGNTDDILANYKKKTKSNVLIYCYVGSAKLDSFRAVFDVLDESNYEIYTVNLEKNEMPDILPKSLGNDFILYKKKKQKKYNTFKVKNGDMEDVYKRIFLIKKKEKEDVLDKDL